MSTEETDIERFIRLAKEKEGPERAALLAGAGGLIGGPILGGAGGAIGAGEGNRLGSGAGGFIGGFAGPVAGMGAYMAHKDTYKEASVTSVAEISAMADLIEEGFFGKEAQMALEGVNHSIERYVEEDLSEKTASSSETDYNIYDENAARLARLNTLLRK